MSDRVRRPGAWLALGVALAAVLAVAVLLSVTRSQPGRAWILAYTLETLGGRLNGQLVVQRLEGNLFTGAKLYELALRESDGTPLLVADSAYIEYELPTFLGGDIVINRLVLFDADLRLQRLPGDSLWNYQKVLQDTSSAETRGEARATVIERLEVVSARATVRLPWEPTATAGRAREREIEGALSDTSRLVVQEAAGGYLRTMGFEVDTAAVTELAIAPAERGGITLAVDALSGRAFLWSEPALEVAGLEGQLSVLEGVVRYQAPAIALPASRLNSAGVVDLTGEEPRYDLQVAGEGVDIADLHWLLPSLPERGAVTGRLWLETRPDGLLYLARDLRVDAPDTRVVGSFGMIVGDDVRFVEADLRAEPLDLRAVQDLLPPAVPVEELRIGALTAETPAS